MKIAIIGSKGMLGYALTQQLRATRHETVTADHAALDIRDQEAAQRFLSAVKPQWVILAAGFTRVDDSESQRDLAFAVNAEGAGNVAQACKHAAAKLVFISTDYVFDGLKDGFYSETDPPNPINAYGASKLAGETKVQEIMRDYLIVRTSWLFGPNGRNFVDTIRAKTAADNALNIVSDQVGCPTYTLDLSGGIIALMEKEARGIFHFANGNSCSWHEFARYIVELSGNKTARVNPILSQSFNAPARRPANSRLSCERFRQVTGYAPRSWQDALRDYLQIPLTASR